MGLGDYSVRYSGGLGVAPSARTFAELGVTSAKIVSLGGGGDYAELSVDVSLTSTGMPFVPLARHDIYDGGGTLRFVGWLMQPARAATPARQQQTFRLEGPMSRLACKVFQQPWNFPLDPTAYDSALAAKVIPRVLLNLEDYVAHRRIDVAAQIKEVLDYYSGLFGGSALSPAPIGYGSLAAIPTVQPPEDEQTDAYCDAIIQRQLKWVPKVTAYWTYPDTEPIRPLLNFSANDPVPGATIDGNVEIVPGGGLIVLNGYQSILIDPASGTLMGFRSTPRYDLLVGKVSVFIGSEEEVAAAGSVDRKLWANVATDVSTVANGSDKEVSYFFDLRGAGGPRDPATGLLRTPKEAMSTGLAAALHAPFKVLTHSLEWSVVGADVDWNTLVGAAVGVRNAGSDLLAGSRSIIQQITRDIGTGTTAYQAGPPTQLGFNDLIALTRFNRTRNAARNGGGSGGGSGGGGYSKGGGPDTKNNGQMSPASPSTSSSGGGSAVAAAPADFSIYDASTGTALKVGVRFGVVTCYRIADGVLPWPANFSASTQYKYEVAATGIGAAWLRITNDTSGDLNKVSAIDLGSGSTVPASDDTYAYILLGTWTVDNSASPPKLVLLAGAGANGIGNQMYNFCGGSHFAAPL